MARMGGSKQLKAILHTNQLMRTYFIASASSTVVTQFQLKCATYDMKWKFPTMTMLHTFLFHVGEYTGYPVAHLRLTQEEGREEMYSDMKVPAVRVHCPVTSYVI